MRTGPFPGRGRRAGGQRWVLRRCRARALGLLPLLAATIAMVVTPRSASAADDRGDFSLDRALRHIRAVAREPHPTGSAANEAVRRYLLETLSGLGLAPEVQQVTIAKDWGSVARSREGTVLSGTVHNVVARVPGTASTGALLLMAHYDSVPTSPGAGDDAVGVAALLETARILPARPVANDVILLVTDGEELGTLGAEAFRRHHPWAADVRFVVNMDARGGGGDPVLFHVRGNGPAALPGYATAPAAHASSVITGLGALAPGSTDLVAFSDLPTGAFDLSLPGNWPDYHTPRDDVDALDPRSVEHQGRTALALTAWLGATDLARLPSDAGVVFSAVPGLGLLRYPAALTVPLLLAASVLGAAQLARARRRGTLRLAGAVAESARLLGAVAGTAAAGALAVAAYPAVTGHDLTLPLGATPAARWAEAGVGMTALAGGLATLAGCGRLGAGEPGAGDRVAGAALTWWGAGGVATVVLPGASHLFLWPLLVAQLGMVLARVPALRRRLLAALPAAAVGGALVLPTADFLAVVLGPRGTVAGACLVQLFLAPALRLVPRATAGPGTGPASSGRRSVAAPLLVPLGCGVALLALHAVLTRPSPTHPRTDHLTYWLDADRSTASWLSLDRAPDAWTRTVLGAEPATGRLGDHLPTRRDRDVLVAAAPVIAVPPPELRVVTDRTEGGDRVVQLHLHSPRRAPTMRLYVTSGTPVRAADVSGTTLRYPQPVSAWWLKASTVPNAGVEVTLTVPAGEELSVLLVDTSPGLPVPVAPRPDSLLPYSEPIMPEDSSVLVARRLSLGTGRGPAS